MRTAGLKTLLIAAAIMSGIGSARAEDTSGQSTAAKEQWSFTVAPYLWGAGLEGDVGTFGLTPVDVDASFGDILKNLDIALMGVAEVRYGRFGLFADLVYVDLTTDSQTTPGPLFGSAKVESKTVFFTPMLEYRLLEDDGSSLDGMAGARVWYSETQIKLSSGLLAGRKFTDDDTWVDPTIGLRGRLALSMNWALAGWGIIGGFGAASDFMWDAFGGVNYSINDWFSLVVGYRGTGTDYQNNGFVYDIVMHGPVIGAVFRF